MKILAQVPLELGKIGGNTPGDTSLGPFGNINFTPKSSLASVTGAISSVIGIMTVAAGIWFILIFLTGGFYWITSSGDKAKLHEARERITNAIIGLIIVVAGWSILALTGQFFGYDIVVSDPGKLIEQFNIK